MTDTFTQEPRAAGVSAWSDGYEWGRAGSDYWSTVPDIGAPATPDVLSLIAEELLAQLASVRRTLEAIPEQLAGVHSPELARITAEACAVVSASEAVRAAVVLDANARGVIASSDNPRVDRFVQQACRDAGVPVSNRQALSLKEIASACDGHDITPLRDAVTSGRISVDSAAGAARFYRTIKSAIGPGNWAPVLDTVITAVADGATRRDLDGCADQIIGQYGNLGALDLDHEAKHVQRDVTAFRRDRHGMLTATVRLDPASETVVTAALTALAAPQPAPDGTHDLRTAGQRRADALVTLAGFATKYHGDIPGSGSKAVVHVTISHDALTTDLAAEGINPYSGHRHDCVFTTSMRATEAAARAATGPHPLLRDLGITHSGSAPAPATAASEIRQGSRVETTPGADRSEAHTLPQPGALSTGRELLDSSADAPACTCGAVERGVGVTEHGQRLTPGEVRMLACDAGVIPILLGGRGEVLDVGRKRRWISPGQRAALVERDGGCTFPRCGAPPSWCDGHHLLEWSRGGPTDLDHLALLCRHHHRETHMKGHVATATLLGVTWTRSDGTPIGNTPRPERCT